MGATRRRSGRRPDLGVPKTKGFWRKEEPERLRKNADDLVIFTPEADGLSHGRGIGSIAPRPEAMAQDRDLRPAVDVLLGGEAPSVERRDPEEGVEVRLDHADVDELGVFLASENELVSGSQGPLLEELAPFAIVEEILRMEGRERLRAVSEIVPEDDDALRARVRERAQQDPVHDAEDGGDGPDSEAQRNETQEREPRTLAERARRELEIQVECLEHHQPRFLCFQHDAALRSKEHPAQAEDVRENAPGELRTPPESGLRARGVGEVALDLAPVLLAKAGRRTSETEADESVHVTKPRSRGV